MSIKKYTDWSTWWDGLRTNIIKCIGTTGVSFLGSNGLSAIDLPGVGHLPVGLNWEQAIGVFGVHIAFEVFIYMKTSQPEVKEIDIPTQFVSKSETNIQNEKTNPTAGS